MHTLSIVIPAYNEHEIIADTLQYLTNTFDDVEMIIIDQSAGDETQDIVMQQFTHVIYERARWDSRPENMNQWAALATWDILLFLHADCRLAADAKSELENLDVDRYVWWWFVRQMEPANWSIRFRDWLAKLWMRWFWFMMWDHGLFVTREAFDAVGGYRDKPLFEDIELVRSLKKYCRKHQKLCYCSQQNIIASSRKFMKHGPWRTFFFMCRCYSLYLIGYPVEKIEKMYRSW